MLKWQFPNTQQHDGVMKTNVNISGLSPFINLKIKLSPFIKLKIN